MNITGCIPFLVLSAIMLSFGSLYYILANLIRSRAPKRAEYTNITKIDFRYFSS